MGDFTDERLWYTVSLTEVQEDGTERRIVREYMNQNKYLKLIETDALKYIKEIYFDGDNDDFKHYITLTKNLSKEEAEEVSEMVQYDDKLIFNAIRNNEYYEFLTSDFIKENSKIQYNLIVEIEKPHTVFHQNNYQVVYLKHMRVLRKEMKKMIDKSEYKQDWQLYLYNIHNVRFV